MNGIRPAISAAFAIGLFAAGCSVSSTVSNRRERNGELRGSRTSEGADEFRRMRWQDENGGIAPDAYTNALLQIERMKASTPRTTAAGVSRNTWTWLGPGNVGGRVTALLNPPTNPDTLIINNPGGGIWRSTDRGATWKPVNDFLSNLAISALALSPTDPMTMYAGTGGGPNQSDDSFGTQLRGAGIFKSTDGGASWTQLASTSAVEFSRGIERIAVSPDGQTVLASAKFFYSNTPTAIFRSTDGGATWSETLKQPGVSGNSVEFHPTDSTKAIASSLTRAFFSTDGGGSWTEATGLPQIGTQGLVAVTYAKSDPNIVYAGVNNNSGEVYRSTDGGRSYTRVNGDTNYAGTQGWYCNVIWVDPANADTVVVAGLDVFRSTDGGKTFTKISKWEKPATKSAHADHGMIVAMAGYDGKTNKDIYFGNDGGIYRVQDINTVEEEAGWQLLNRDLGITQLYGAAVNPQSGIIVAGAQDNGTQRYSGDINKWTDWQGGDGGYCAADPTNPNIFYGEYTFMTIYRSDDGGLARPDDVYGFYDFFDGTQWVKKTRPGAITEAKNGTANFIAPFILDPNKPNRMLAGARSLWASDNINIPKSAGFPSWTTIKPPAGEEAANNIASIAVAPGNSDIIWVGHNNGDVFVTTNGLSSTPDWKKVSSDAGPLPRRFVARIAIDPRDAKTVYATFGGFSANNVWKTADGGANWQPATGSGSSQLPQVPVYTLAVHPTNSKFLYAGTETGIFTSEDGGNSWTVPQDGPANVSVNDLFFPSGTTTLYAATYGRGLWKVDVPVSSGKTALTCYSLTLAENDASRGGVTVDVAPNCNSTQYSAGTVVHVAAHTRAPYGFARWSGDANDEVASTTITMNANRIVTANFTATQACYTLTMSVTPGNAGSVSLLPAPNCGANGYTAGTEVGFHATANNPFAFAGWGGDYFDVDPVGSVTMDENVNITAIFAMPATNDEPATATDISSVSTVVEDTSNASGSSSDPDTCKSGKSGKTVWFRYVARDNGELRIDTNGSNYHTVVAVYTGFPGALQSVACSDRALPGTPIVDYGDSELASDELAGVRLQVRSGTTYLIEVGDGTQPEQKEIEFDTGDDPSDVPDGGLLQMHATFTKTSIGRHRAVSH